MRVIRESAESDEISRSDREHANAVERLAGDGLYRLRRHLARHAGTAAAGHAVQAGRLDATEEELSPKRRPGASGAGLTNRKELGNAEIKRSDLAGG